MLQHPVKERIQLLYTFLFVPITKITEDPFLHIDRKLLIINTVLRKVLDMDHSALASVQRAECFTVRALQFPHRPDPAKSDTKSGIDPVFQP